MTTRVLTPLFALVLLGTAAFWWWPVAPAAAAPEAERNEPTKPPVTEMVQAAPMQVAPSSPGTKGVLGRIVFRDGTSMPAMNGVTSTFEVQWPRSKVKLKYTGDDGLERCQMEDGSIWMTANQPFIENGKPAGRRDIIMRWAAPQRVSPDASKVLGDEHKPGKKPAGDAKSETPKR